ncbi:MAG: pilus assembly protein TadG-related protein [Hyphomicrobium sp.]|jgi:Flp pilus assembly protein TadG
MHWPLTSFARRFGHDESGNVAIIFGLASTAILLAAGLGLDYARTVNMNSRISAAADAATLAAGRAMLDGKLNDDEVEDLAKKFVDQNARGGGAVFGTYAEPVVALDRETGSVKIDVDVRVPTTLSRITGINELRAPVSTAAVFGQSDVEVAVALDVTGSMSEYARDGKRKIDSLKESFATFVTKLLPEHKPDGRKVRIAVAPYSSGVNLGDYADKASHNRSRDNCVIERTGAAAASDAPVGTSSYFKVHEDQPRDTDNTEGRQDYTCPKAEIIPLTDNADTLTSAVGNYRASGSTSGHLGLQWAWNLISEDWTSFWGGDSRPDPYARTFGQDSKRPELTKAIILMSDGIFNTSFYNGTSAAQAEAICNNIKSGSKTQNVLIFSIAFGNPPAQAKRTLEACASTKAYYAEASGGAELQAAFSKFAGILTQLRLTQ